MACHPCYVEPRQVELLISVTSILNNYKKLLIGALAVFGFEAAPYVDVAVAIASCETTDHCFQASLFVS